MKSKKDESADPAKRQWPRLSPSDVPSLKALTINQGTEAQVIDISRGGTLIETEVRLRPQMKIMLKVVTTKGVFKITGIVLRSSIKSLKGIPIYQSAISFETPLTMLEDLEQKPEVETQAGESPSGIPDIFEDASPAPLPPVAETKAGADPAIFTVIAPDGFGISFNESFRLNDW